MSSLESKGKEPAVPSRHKLQIIVTDLSTGEESSLTYFQVLHLRTSLESRHGFVVADAGQAIARAKDRDARVEHKKGSEYLEITLRGIAEHGPDGGVIYEIREPVPPTSTPD